MSFPEGYGTSMVMDSEPALYVRDVPPCAFKAANAWTLATWVPEGRRTIAEVGDVGPETYGTRTGFCPEIRIS